MAKGGACVATVQAVVRGNSLNRITDQLDQALIFRYSRDICLRVLQRKDFERNELGQVNDVVIATVMVIRRVFQLRCYMHCVPPS